MSLQFQTKTRRIEVTVKEAEVYISQDIVRSLVTSHILATMPEVSCTDSLSISFLNPDMSDDAVRVTVTRDLGE